MLTIAKFGPADGKFVLEPPIPLEGGRTFVYLLVPDQSNGMAP
jgi:hypothetical protein